MDYDIFDGNQSDSDAIDEELERQLYGAIFFETDSQLPVKAEPNPQSVLNYSVHSPINQNSALSPPADHESNQNVNGDRISLTRDVLSDNSILQTDTAHLEQSMSVETDAFTKDSAGSVLISSFKDQSTSDSDASLERKYSELTQSGHFSSTDYETEESDCESISSINLQRSKLSSSTPRSSCAPPWDADNIVLGVSREASSIVCNAEDSMYIAKLLESSSKDPSFWRISHEDRVVNRSKKARGRYFNDSQNSICSKCEKKGHLAVECRKSGPTCILCGFEGHRREDCNRVYCYACFSPGHSKHNCVLLECLKRSVCKRCGLQGHQAHLCTELWRQYRNTVEPGKPIPIPRRMDVHPGGCCNCGNRGHTVDECRRKPFRSNFLGPPPRHRVLVYDQRDIYKRWGHNVPSSSSQQQDFGLGKDVEKKYPVSKKKNQKDPKLSRPQKLHRPSNAMKLAKSKKKPKLMDESEPTVEHLEQSINKKLFEQILAQKEKDKKLVEELPAATGTEHSTPSPDEQTLPPARRKPSMDGAAFLPLDPTPAPANRKHQFTPHRANCKQNRSFVRNPKFSPFAWINDRTARSKLNSERGSFSKKTKLNNRDRLDPLFTYDARPNSGTKKRNRLPGNQPVVPSETTSKKTRKLFEKSTKSKRNPIPTTLSTIKDKGVKRKKKARIKQASQIDSSSMSAEQLRKSHIGLQSLLVLSDQPSNKSSAEITDSNRETLATTKKRKANKKRRNQVCTQSSQQSPAECLPHKDQAGSMNWGHFLRNSSRVDPWDEVTDTASYSSITRRKRKKNDFREVPKNKKKKLGKGTKLNRIKATYPE